MADGSSCGRSYYDVIICFIDVIRRNTLRVMTCACFVSTRIASPTSSSVQDDLLESIVGCPSHYQLDMDSGEYDIILLVYAFTNLSKLHPSQSNVIFNISASVSLPF